METRTSFIWHRLSWNLARLSHRITAVTRRRGASVSYRGNPEISIKTKIVSVFLFFPLNCLVNHSFEKTQCIQCCRDVLRERWQKELFLAGLWHARFERRPCCPRAWEAVMLTMSFIQKDSEELHLLSICSESLFVTEDDCLPSLKRFDDCGEAHIPLHAIIDLNSHTFKSWVFHVEAHGWRSTRNTCISMGAPISAVISAPSCHQRVVADLTLEERTCLNLLFSSCMLGDLGLARWRPPLLFSPFPPPSARITWNAGIHWDQTWAATSNDYNYTLGVVHPSFHPSSIHPTIHPSIIWPPLYHNCVVGVSCCSLSQCR